MSKKINVVITSGGGGTPVTYALSRNINSAGWVVIEASLAYTASPQTYEDTNSNAGFSTSDSVEYRATATNADGTSAVATVVTQSVVATYGLDLLTSNAGALRIPHTLTTENFKIEIQPITRVFDVLSTLIGNNVGSTTPGYFSVTATGLIINMYLYDSSTKSVVDIPYTRGSKISVERTSTTNINLLINDIIVGGITCEATYDVYGADWNICSRNTISNWTNAKLIGLWYTVGGVREQFLPTTQASGTPLVGSESTNCVIYATVVNDCYFAL